MYISTYLFSDLADEHGLTRTNFKRKMMTLGFSLADFPDEVSGKCLFSCSSFTMIDVTNCQSIVDIICTYLGYVVVILPLN